MSYDKELINAKLRRWDNYVRHYRLPNWDDIPDFGLYMEQVTTLISQYLNYLPSEDARERERDREEMFPITPSAINNYVRTRVMPEPVKKRYYRIHIAYLIMICSLKQSLSIAMIKKLIPMGITENEVKRIYNEFIERHHYEVDYFAEQLQKIANPLYDVNDARPEALQSSFKAHSTEDLIYSMALIAGFSKLLAQKLVMLDGKSLHSGENLELRFPEED
ncbi:MAG: DUF1836 domain-containing protein [Lachnospiraceae bacterium]|nr:DUF1836 domain-containing protein [Lachnospiraceae bacterium]MBQ7260429.1 DUF1836 domain-containing protein [Lachnospiraceae bacterium]HAV01582.1 hypothetical protein [Lachnospiraceae bacterium]